MLKMRFVNINPKWPDGMADKRVESVAPRGGGWGMINAAEIAFGFASNSYKGGVLECRGGIRMTHREK